MEFWNLYEGIIKAFPGAVENINDSLAELTAKGKEILNNVEEKEKHDRMMKGIKSYAELSKELVDMLELVKE